MDHTGIAVHTKESQICLVADWGASRIGLTPWQTGAGGAGGREAHIWEGVPTLLLTTTGRSSGVSWTTPLIYGRDGQRYLFVAWRGGAPQHPDWYKNLAAQVQVMGG